MDCANARTYIKSCKKSVIKHRLKINKNKTKQDYSSLPNKVYMY